MQAAGKVGEGRETGVDGDLDIQGRVGSYSLSWNTCGFGATAGEVFAETGFGFGTS